MIYFIEAVGAGLVKIGFTERETVNARLKELQTACPHELRVLATVAGNQSDEGVFHRNFAHLRTSGEWLRVFTLIAKWAIFRVDKLDDRVDALEASVAGHERELNSRGFVDGALRINRFDMIESDIAVMQNEWARVHELSMSHHAQIGRLWASVGAASQESRNDYRLVSGRSLCADCRM